MVSIISYENVDQWQIERKRLSTVRFRGPAVGCWIEKSVIFAPCVECRSTGFASSITFPVPIHVPLFILVMITS